MEDLMAMTALTLTALLLTNMIVYEKVKTTKPKWQLRAELSAMVTGLAVWILVSLALVV